MEEEEEEALGEEVKEVMEKPGSISREVYNVVKCYFGIPGRPCYVRSCGIVLVRRPLVVQARCLCLVVKEQRNRSHLY